MIASCPELVTYPMPSSTSKMVETMGANYPTTASSGSGGVKNRSRGRRAKKGQETSWVYLNPFEDFSDVRTRNRLMNAYNSSSSDDEPIVRHVPAPVNTTAHLGSSIGVPSSASHFHPNLHALHQFRRERKKGLVSDKNVVISYRPRVRLNLVNRRNFYYRVSDKELDALRAFNFLDEFSVSSQSENENEASCSEYLFSMEYEPEQDVEQKQVDPLIESDVVEDEELMEDEQKDEMVQDEHMPNINENISLIENLNVPGTTEIRRESPDCDLQRGTMEIVGKDGDSEDCLADSLLWSEEQDIVDNFVDQFLNETCEITFRGISKGDVIEVNDDAIEDDGFHDNKPANAPPSPPLSVALDRLSLSDSCTESYFGSDSGGSSFLGGK